MAFRARWKPGDAVNIDYFTNGHEHNAIANIGENDHDLCSYSSLVYLAPLPGSGINVELGFCIVEYDAEADFEYVYSNGRDTKRKIEDVDDRRMCAAIIGSSVGLLLDNVSPSYVFMQTCSPDLPAKAMRKYEIVLEVFTQKGYSVEEQDPYHGRLSWWMERTRFGLN